MSIYFCFFHSTITFQTHQLEREKEVCTTVQV